jgi:hypothetical protein
MLTRTLTILISLSLLSSFAFGQKNPAGQGNKSSTSEIVGKWEGGVTVGEQSMKITLELKNEGSKIAGQLHTGHGVWTVTDVKFANGKWTIAWRTPEGGTGKMIGAVKDNKLAGDWDFSPAFVGAFEVTKTTSASK